MQGILPIPSMSSLDAGFGGVEVVPSSTATAYLPNPSDWWWERSDAHENIFLPPSNIQQTYSNIVLENIQDFLAFPANQFHFFPEYLMFCCEINFNYSRRFMFFLRDLLQLTRTGVVFSRILDISGIF